MSKTSKTPQKNKNTKQKLIKNDKHNQTTTNKTTKKQKTP